MIDVELGYPFYPGLDGLPLQFGAIYYGVAGQNPVTNPVAVYWDAAGTQPAGQPISVQNGRPINNGAPARVFVSGDYSKQVIDSRGRQVLYEPSQSSRNLGSLPFTQSTAYAAGSMGAKAQQVMSVKDAPFNAKGDGITDDTAALQAAINAAGATRALDFLDGTYLCGELTFPNGINWRGRGAVLKCAAAATAVNNWIRAVGTQQSGSVEGITFDYQGNANGRHILQIGDNARNWRLVGNTFKGMNTRAALRADWNVSVAGDGYIEIRANTFSGGQGAGAVNFLAQLPNMGIRDISFIDNQVIDCGGSMCMMAMVKDTDDAGAGRFGAFKGTRISGNRFVGNGTGTFGAIPTEMWGHDNLTITGNVVDTATRGLGFSWCRNAVSVANAISNQTSYAHEIGTVDGLLITGETIKNCKQFVFDDGDTPGKLSKNISIIGNIIDGSGLAAPIGNVYPIQFAPTVNNVGSYRTGVKVSGNKFVNLTYQSGAMRLVNVRYAEVSGNEFYRTAEVEGIGLCRLTKSADCNVHDNSVHLTGPYTANTPLFDNEPAVLAIEPDPLTDNNTIHRNTVVSEITSIAGSGFVALGAVTAPSDFKNTRISDNVLVGTFQQFVFLNDNGGKAVVRDNHTGNATETIASAITATYVKLLSNFDGTAAPVSGTWRRGQIVFNRNMASGSPVGWACTVAGTPGTWVAMANLP